MRWKRRPILLEAEAYAIYADEVLEHLSKVGAEPITRRKSKPPHARRS